MPTPELIDAWWAALDPGRRAQIFSWLAGREASLDHPHIDGQTDILDELRTDHRS